MSSVKPSFLVSYIWTTQFLCMHCISYAFSRNEANSNTARRKRMCSLAYDHWIAWHQLLEFTCNITLPSAPMLFIILCHDIKILQSESEDREGFLTTSVQWQWCQSVLSSATIFAAKIWSTHDFTGQNSVFISSALPLHSLILVKMLSHKTWLLPEMSVNPPNYCSNFCILALALFFLWLQTTQLFYQQSHPQKANSSTAFFAHLGFAASFPPVSSVSVFCSPIMSLRPAVCDTGSFNIS